MSTGRLIAIGDVHGCGHALDAVLEAIEPTTRDQFVFLGDMIDQGRESRDVLERIIVLRRQCQVVLIQGNHEEMLYAARGDEKTLRYWENCGGVATLNSYRFGGTLADIPPEHWALLDTCVPYYESDECLFTHANYRADLALDEQSEFTLRWELFDPASQQPHSSGKTVVVGHTEQTSAEILDLGFAVCIDTTCWRYGWLTALDLASREVWQASRWGVLRESEETSHRDQLKELLQPDSHPIGGNFGPSGAATYHTKDALT
jgi:serine/threonine protein phosphatase 1